MKKFRLFYFEKKQACLWFCAAKGGLVGPFWRLGVVTRSPTACQVFFENLFLGLHRQEQQWQLKLPVGRPQNNHSPMLDNYIDATDMNGREGITELNL
jgi:hypothetical protein